MNTAYYTTTNKQNKKRIKIIIIAEHRLLCRGHIRIINKLKAQCTIKRTAIELKDSYQSQGSVYSASRASIATSKVDREFA